jgi:hypothetical protein
MMTEYEEWRAELTGGKRSHTACVLWLCSLLGLAVAGGLLFRYV